MPLTVIRNADMVVAWDAAAKSHVYMPDADVVFEGGVLQVHRRISTPEALDWTERTRVMFGGLYPQYAFGSLEDRCFAIRPR